MATKVEESYLDAVVAISYVMCMRCKREQKHFDEMELVKCLIKDGWIAVNEEVICPECKNKK